VGRSLLKNDQITYLRAARDHHYSHNTFWVWAAWEPLWVALHRSQRSLLLKFGRNSPCILRCFCFLGIGFRIGRGLAFTRYCQLSFTNTIVLPIPILYSIVYIKNNSIMQYRMVGGGHTVLRNRVGDAGAGVGCGAQTRGGGCLQITGLILGQRPRTKQIQISGIWYNKGHVEVSEKKNLFSTRKRGAIIAHYHNNDIIVQYPPPSPPLLPTILRNIFFPQPPLYLYILQ